MLRPVDGAARRAPSSRMNAVEHMIPRIPAEAIRRLAALRPSRFSDAEPAARGLDVDEATARLVGRWGGDLCGLLNAMTRDELEALAGRCNLRAPSRAPELREALWAHGASLERSGVEVSHAVQPRPILLGGHLVIQAPPRGMYPPSDAWPRAIPPSRPAQPPRDEPEAIDELLAAADRLIGVRLGARGRDKGAWGQRAARLLGIIERNEAEPDWRGDVEIKTIPIERDAGGWWRVVEDPAIAMAGEAAFAKLARTLWLARCDVAQDDATIVSWYLLDWDPHVARLARRYLHERPKGPAGTDARASYLHRRFFAEAGLLATLNGGPRA